MCHFVTMVAPPKSDLGNLKKVLKRYHRTMKLVENRFVHKHLKAGEQYFAALPKFCDCGTGLGSLRNDAVATQVEQQRRTKDLERLRRKGWSEAKISRWETARTKHVERCLQPVPDDGPDEWPDLIRSVIKDLNMPYVGILLHMYNGGFETAPKDIMRSQLKLNDDLRKRLYEMKEDVLYVIEP